MVFTSFFGNTKLATMMSSEQARFMTFKRTVVERAPYLLENNKTVNMSLGSDSVCFQMIPTELANKGYETGLQFDSFCSKTLESHHLNMTFTSVIQDPECWTGLSTNPLSWQGQPAYHFKTSVLCLTWFKNRGRVNLELEEAWACHSSITIPTVERLRGSLWPLSAANKVVFPLPWKKTKPQRNTLSQCLTESWHVFFSF